MLLDHTVTKDSLLAIPLVRRMATDAWVPKLPVGVDKGWAYKKIVPHSVTGFNPFTGGITYARNSFVSEWIQRPEAPARAMNPGNHLLREVLFLVHDYLHVWSLALILNHGRGLDPDAPLNKANAEDWVFVHLLTEAAATIGLDYWYLSSVDLNSECNLGTNLEALTTSFHTRHIEEFRRFDPGFESNGVPFFENLVGLYCNGAFRGFDTADVVKSPLLLSWLRHELEYGRLQRVYARRWFEYQLGTSLYPFDADLDRPLNCQARWQKELVIQVAEALQALVLEKGSIDFSRKIPSFGISRSMTSPAADHMDFRFVNLHTVDIERELTRRRNWLEPENARFFCHQYLSSFPFKEVHEARRTLAASLQTQGQVRLLMEALKEHPRLSPEAEEPPVLMYFT